MFSVERTKLLRDLHGRQDWPAPIRWTVCAFIMRDFLRLLSRKLKKELGDDARLVFNELLAETYRRRYAHLRAAFPELPPDEDRTIARFMAGLYQLPVAPKFGWILDGLGGMPRGTEWFSVAKLQNGLDAEARWREITVHLGEVLIVVTERLPAKIPRIRGVVSEMCFKMGERHAKRMRKVLKLPDDTPVANAIEVLRATEYIFRVNPVHTTGADEKTGIGFIDGNACPWYSRPGWQPGHCGIFGQFQSGVCSAFDLRYRLLETIPKHGGDHCKVELSPIPLRRSAGGETLGGGR